MIDPAYAFSGLTVGTLVGLTGVGGGSLMTPLLILLFGISPTSAVGTDLLFAACTKTVGAAVHNRSQTIDWTVTKRLMAGSLPMTVATMLVLHYLSAHAVAVTRIVTPVLAVAILLSAVMILFRNQALPLVANRIARIRPDRLTVVTGAVLGVLVTLSSVGAGALGVTTLTLLYPKLPMPKIVGSDIAHAIPLTLLAGTGYWLLGAIDWHLLESLLTGSIPGVVLGSVLATRIPVTVLRAMLAIVLIIAAGRLLI